MTVKEIIEEVADLVDGKVYENYSGRGMYGRNCMGIVCEETLECVEEAAAMGLRGAQVDSMGLSSIVYWPRLEADQEIETEDLP